METPGSQLKQSQGPEAAAEGQRLPEGMSEWGYFHQSDEDLNTEKIWRILEQIYDSIKKPLKDMANICNITNEGMKSLYKKMVGLTHGKLWAAGKCFQLWSEELGALPDSVREDFAKSTHTCFCTQLRECRKYFFPYFSPILQKQC